MADSRHWWQSILARSLFAAVGVVVLLGGVSSRIVSQTVGDQERNRTIQRLNELIDTVESTASIASFTGDKQLASEVAQGLIRNSDVLRVVIRAGDNELALAEREAKPSLTRQKLGAGGTAASWQVARRLTSPFKQGEVVGDIVLDADSTAIDARIDQSIRETILFLTGQMALVVAALAASMFLLVVRPIKAISDRLHSLDAASGGRLDVPPGHGNSEIGRLVGDINGLAGRLVATLEQERTLQQQQAIAQRMYQDLFEHASSGIFVANRDGRLESYNRAFIDLTWLRHQEGIAERKIGDAGWREPERLLSLLSDSLDDVAGNGMHGDDFLLAGRRGGERWLHVAVTPLGNGSLQGTVTDVTQRKNEELYARRLAVTDPLTGFANRAGLQGILAEMTKSTAGFTLVMFDLDGFKQINDAMGFPTGDELLLNVAARIHIFLRDEDSAARIGGDEFVLILRGDQERQAMDERMDRLLILLERPYELCTQENPGEVFIGASVGVATYPKDGDDLHQLLRSAELALNGVRAAGGRDYRYFDPAQLAAIEHRRRLEDDLRHALGAGELHLAFQPIIDLTSDRLAGAEALMRWTHPEHGAISPDVFIPLAEEIGLIGEIGQMALHEACRQVAAWRAMGLDLYVSVNVSVRQIPDELPPLAVINMLKQHDLPTEALAIEITEGLLMSNVTIAQSWIESLRAAGIRIYLDDFGTGYSSLSYLKRFPMDTVKIDKSFIRDMTEDNSDRTLVDAIVTMARSLGLNVVAEGVENESQLEILRQIGCGYGQGYHFSRPVSGNDFVQVAERINARAVLQKGLSATP